jgi:Protein-L-isoaspartate(D-aspartate) O-methyltransferase (PCMT)
MTPFTGPFDAIHVGAAAPTLPQALVDQLARPGRMFIPVGVYSQDIIQVDKAEDGSVTQKRLFAVQVRPSGKCYLRGYRPKRPPCFTVCALDGQGEAALATYLIITSTFKLTP